MFVAIFFVSVGSLIDPRVIVDHWGAVLALTMLVITGKGSTGRGLGGQGMGILRQVVPRWLNESPLRPLVLAIHRAQPKDGGDGALYVLLKRRR